YERFKNAFVWTAEFGWLWWDGRRWSRGGADAKVSKAAHRTVRLIQDEAKAIAGTSDDQVIRTKGRSADKSDVMLLDVLRGWGRAQNQLPRLKALKKEAEGSFERKASEFDADPFCINVRNGTLFIRKPGDVRTNLPLPERARRRSRQLRVF